MTDDAPVVIRPVLTRRVSFAVIPIVLNLGVICGLAGAGATSLGLRATVAAVGIGLAALCYAVQGRPRLIAGPQHLHVRNFATSHTLDWAQIADMTYTGRAPWPHVRLVSGETVALHALQRWDKEHAIAAATSLRAQLARHRAKLAAAPKR